MVEFEWRQEFAKQSSQSDSGDLPHLHLRVTFASHSFIAPSILLALPHRRYLLVA